MITLNILCLILSLCQSIPRPAAAAQTQPEKISSHVLLVVIGGLRLEDLNKADSLGLRIPALRSLRTRGAHAVSVDGVYPSTTLPSAATIATGLLPADHGIVEDAPLIDQGPDLSILKIKTDTLWNAAKRNGYSVASLGFPLTESVELDFNLRAPVTDDLKTGALMKLIEPGLPNLVLLHYASFEIAQRRYGIRSKQALAALETIDGDLLKIIEAIEKSSKAGQTTYLVASDHGAMAIESVFKPNVVIERKGWLTLDGRGQVKSWRAVAHCFGGSAAIFVRDQNDSAEIEKVFQEYHQETDSPVWRVLNAREIAQLGADPRAVLYLDAAPGFAMSPAATGSRTGSADDRSASGYLPSRSEMRAILLLGGRGIKPGSKIEYARLTDIAPTVSRLMGLDMPTARGRVLSEVIVK